MTSLKITTAAAALVALTAPAFAGGYAEPQPYIAVPTPTVIPQPGQDWTGPSVGLRLGYGVANLTADFDGDGDDDEIDEDGLLYGLSAAYDFDFGNIVAGVGASVDAIDANGLERVARIGPRVGVDLGSRLVYATAGYAHLWTEDDEFEEDGYFAGVGAEQRLTETLSVGGEVLYHDFGEVDNTGIDADAVTANISLNLRF